MSILIFLLSVSCDALRLNAHSRKIAAGPGIGTYRNEAYMPLQGPFKDKFFGRVSLTDNIWDSLPGVSFNPSIVALPSQGKEFNAGHEKARFVVSVRTHSWHQCANLGIGATQTREARFPQRGGNHTSLVLLDANFRPLTTLSEVDLGNGEDVRLSIENGKMVVSYVTWDLIPTWHLQCLELASQGDGWGFNSGLKATRAPLTNAFPDLQEELKYDKEKNLGVINYNGKAYILWHANPRASDVRPLLTKEERPVGYDTSYHLSGNPVHIPEKGVYLSVLHKHKPTQKGLTRAGTEYLHYFILMKDQPPFGLQKVGAPFCIPSQSPDHANECEIIQFIGSMQRDPQDPQTLMISYGINDCESAIVRLPLEAVLESTQHAAPFLGDLGFIKSAPMNEPHSEAMFEVTPGSQ